MYLEWQSALIKAQLKLNSSMWPAEIGYQRNWQLLLSQEHLLIQCSSGLIPVCFRSASLRIMQMDVLSR